jgi:hypothetical protein
VAIQDVSIEPGSEFSLEKHIFASEKENGGWAEVLFWHFDYPEFKAWLKSWEGKVKVTDPELEEFLEIMCPVRVNWMAGDAYDNLANIKYRIAHGEVGHPVFADMGVQVNLADMTSDLQL